MPVCYASDDNTGTIRSGNRQYVLRTPSHWLIVCANRFDFVGTTIAGSRHDSTGTIEGPLRTCTAERVGYVKGGALTYQDVSYQRCSIYYCCTALSYLVSYQIREDDLSKVNSTKHEKSARTSLVCTDASVCLECVLHTH